MYKTKDNQDRPSGQFNWETYFNNRKIDEIPPPLDAVSTQALFGHLKENHFEITLQLTKVIRHLLESHPLRTDLSVLELGAATGFLSRWLLDQYGGHALLVDVNERSQRAYQDLNAAQYYQIDYMQRDIFELELPGQYDVVGSFGLVEHFADKGPILGRHAQFLKPDGVAIILVPMDTPLNRVYWELHQELNQGYRELLTEREFIDIFTDSPLQLLKTSHSFAYSYDFIAGLAIRR